MTEREMMLQVQEALEQIRDLTPTQSLSARPIAEAALASLSQIVSPAEGK